MTPWVGPRPAEGHEACPRCGFTIDFTELSPKGAIRLRDMMDEHLSVCQTLPSTGQFRALKRSVRSAAFLKGPVAALEVLEDGLAEIGRGA